MGYKIWPKKCLICSRTFFTDGKKGTITFNRRKTCSRNCSNVIRKQFKHTPEAIEKIRKDAIKVRKENPNIYINSLKKARKAILKNPIEWRRKLSETHKGEKSSSWKGGVSSLQEQIRNLFEYQDWKYKVSKKCKHTCVFCGSKKNIQIDHIKPFAVIFHENKIKSVQDALNCPEFWDIINGRVLCKPCHRKTETYGNTKYFRKKVSVE